MAGSVINDPTAADRLRAQGIDVETVADILGTQPAAAAPSPHNPHVRYYRTMLQGSDEWLAARCGMLTASEMKLVVTPTLKVADNDKVRTHLYELLAQRITGHVEPHYISDDMLRGKDDEIEAVILYNQHIGIVDQVGFIVNDRHGFEIGYSPDGVVGSDGLVECKSRRQKYQIQTLVEWVPNGLIDPDFIIQCQTGLLVSERQWIDVISYSGGLHMPVVRVWPDEKVQTAILEGASAFERKLEEKRAIYRDVLESGARLIPTERKIEQEMHT